MTSSSAHRPSALERLLLPQGFADIYPPQAAQQERLREEIMRKLGRRGYLLVVPPLLEIEAGMLAGAGLAVAEDTFRLLDPEYGDALALRADLTPQLMRIAGSHLAQMARPLRLCAAGQVLRAHRRNDRLQRQLTLLDAELIGSAHPEAVYEVITLAGDVMAEVGIKEIIVDIMAPALAAACTPELPPALLPRLRRAAARKDARELRDLGAPLLAELAALFGPAADIIDRLQALPLPKKARSVVENLRALLALMHERRPDMALTCDALEYLGFSYNEALAFAFFSPHTQGELGRGGCYVAPARVADKKPEPAVGFSLDLHAVTAATSLVEERKIFLPSPTPAAQATALWAGGWVTIPSLGTADRYRNPRQEAQRLGCSHIWLQGRAQALKEG